MAGALFAAVLILLLLPVLLSKQVATHRLIPLETPPEVLKQRASDMAKSFGYTQLPADNAYGFRGNRNYYAYLVEHRRTLKPWEVLRHGQPGLIGFWYRQSSGALVPYSQQFVTLRDPPTQSPGMVHIVLDTEGKLTYFEAVPDQVHPQTTSAKRLLGGPAIRDTLALSESQPGGKPAGSPAAPSNASSDQALDTWPRLFQAAGMDIGKFQPVESEWTPPQPYDSRRAWSGVYPNLPQIPIRVESATYQGRPVYFEIVSPWSRPVGAFVPETAGEKSSTWLLLGIFFGTMLIGGFLAFRNLRSGRGDRRGAFRVALFLFVLRMVHWVFVTHHVAETSELMLLVTGLQSALFWGCFAGLLYLASRALLTQALATADHFVEQAAGWRHSRPTDWERHSDRGGFGVFECDDYVSPTDSPSMAGFGSRHA